MNSKLDSNNNSLLYKTPNEQLKATVTARRKDIFEHGNKEPGITTGCSPKTKPDWFDPVAFTHAQQLYHTYEVVIRISQFYGLFLTCINPKVAGPLRSTGNSRTIAHLFTRYLSTMIHIRNWYESDPFEPNSKAYRSLMTVRGYHRQVYAKLNDGKIYGHEEVWINQKRMSLAAFDFMGLMTLFPKELGFATFTLYDFHCMFHFWRVITYCLGQADQFNFCSGTDEEIIELCSQVYTEYWIPRLKRVFQDEPSGVQMYRGITIGIARYIPLINFNVFLRYASKFLELDSEDFPLETLWEKIAYRVFSFGIWASNQGVVINSIFATLNRGVFWICVKLRKFHEWRLEKSYGDQVEFETDDRCPFEVKLNYTTACDLNLF